MRRPVARSFFDGRTMNDPLDFHERFLEATRVRVPDRDGRNLDTHDEGPQ
jgi:hypothetical protein